MDSEENTKQATYLINGRKRANITLRFDPILNDCTLHLQHLSLFVILKSKNHVSVVCLDKEGPH